MKLKTGAEVRDMFADLFADDLRSHHGEDPVSGAGVAVWANDKMSVAITDQNYGRYEMLLIVDIRIVLKTVATAATIEPLLLDICW